MNYLVTLSFDHSEVITQDQYKELCRALFDMQGDFLMINDVIVQRRDVRLIEPTTKKTKSEILLIEEQKAKNQEKYQEPIIRKELPSFKDLVSLRKL